MRALTNFVAAAEGHAHDVDAVRPLELLHELPARKRAVAQGAGLGLRQRDQLGNGLDLELRIHDQRFQVEFGDRLEILLGIERQAAEQELL